MVSLASVHQRCLELLADVPKFRFGFRPKADPHGLPATEHEIFVSLRELDSRERARIDVLTRQIVLDWKRIEEAPQTWFLIEQRVRAAVFLLEHILGTLGTEDELSLHKDSADEALEWALVKLWPFSGPLWFHRACRLMHAGLDLSSRESLGP